MAGHDDVIELERRGWTALTTSGDEAARFYDELLADDVVMVLPGGMVIAERAQAVAAMAGPPWDHVDLGPLRAVALTDDCVAVVYRATAHRSGSGYEAWFTSTYARRDDAWRLAVHQQTPV